MSKRWPEALLLCAFVGSFFLVGCPKASTGRSDVQVDGQDHQVSIDQDAIAAQIAAKINAQVSVPVDADIEAKIDRLLDIQLNAAATFALLAEQITMNSGRDSNVNDPWTFRILAVLGAMGVPMYVLAHRFSATRHLVDAVKGKN